MAVNGYDIGDLVVLKNGTFLNSASVAVDPPTVLCKVENPYGVETIYTYGIDTPIEKLAVGVYRCTIKPTIPGIWKYRWQAVDASASITVALEGAEEASFFVRATVFA